MRHALLAAVLLSLFPAAAWASNYPYVQDGPVILGVTDTEAWVTWYTAHHEGTGTECTIEENTPILGDSNTDTPTLTLSPGGALFTDSTCDRTHKVHLINLTASTTYAFTLDKPWDAKGGTTAAGSFTTAPAAGSGAAVKFVVYGDTRNDLALGGTDTSPNHQAVVSAILAHESDSAFLVHTGDMALNIIGVSGDDKGYSEFFSIERPLLSTRPLFIVLGNHETLDTSYYDSMFDPPQWTNPVSPHPYYSSFDWGKAHVALGDSFEGAHSTLTGNAPLVTDAQAQWMDADLQNAASAHQTSFLAIHQGPYSHTNSSSGHGGSVDVVAKLVPLMIKYGVLASFGGHDHYYQRGHEGCIDYMVVGGGGAPMYDPDSTAPGVITSLKQTSYMVVTVPSSGSASMVVKDVNGAVIDSFTFVTPDAACGAVDGGGAPDAGAGSDAGTDAGAADAGGADAGTSDAGGADAGGADAGTSDAGGADAGGADAGTSDAGGTDAGGTDAGGADAGTSTDAGATDSGGADSDAGGSFESINGGCGCTTSNGALLEGLGLIALLGVWRARRTVRGA